MLFRRSWAVFLACCTIGSAGLAVTLSSNDVRWSQVGSIPALSLGSDLLSAPAMDELNGQQQSRDQWLAQRANPEAALARQRSRFAYERLGALAAARLTEHALPAVTAPASSGLGQVPAGVHLQRYLSPTVARVSLPGGRQGMVESLTPIASPAAKGGYSPIDLHLHATSHGFAPSNSNVELSISKSLADGAGFSNGVSLTPVAASGRPLRGAGELLGATVFYPGSATDTDTAIKATPTGFETYDLLRSIQSPQELSFKIGAPRGASVQTIRGGSGAVQVVSGGRTIAVVPTPFASDATGEPVEVSTRLSGDTLHLKVAHRGGDYAYPIAVDPTVVDSNLIGSTSAPTNWRVEKGGESEGKDIWGLKWSGTGWTMYVGSAHQPNEWGALLYPTQGESHIYEMSMETLAADAGANVENHLAIFGRKGTEEPTWEARTAMGTSYTRTFSTVCISVNCGGGVGTAGNVAGYWINATGTGSGGEVFLFTASVYIEQANGPTASLDTTDSTVGSSPNVLYGSGSWWGPHYGSVKAFGKDLGVGVRELLYEVGTVKWKGESFSCTVQCPPAVEQVSKLAGAGNEAPPDGEPTLTVKAVNGMGTVGSVSTKVKVDYTAPYEITISGLPSGNSITDANRTVKIVGKAKDGSGTTPSSGIASLKLLIDGKEVGSPSGSCSRGPCTATGEWTIAGEDYGAGTHKISLVATDAAENKANSETTFTVHHASPMDIGPGQVNPVNGEFDLEETDVSIPTADTSLRVTRAYDSREPEAGSDGPLGSPWTISFGGAQSIVEEPNGDALLVDVGGHRSVFTNTGSGNYKSPVGDTNLTLTKANGEFKLANKGTSVGFTHTSGDVEDLYRPTIATDTGGTNSTLYSYAVVGGIAEPTEALAPVPAGVSCAPELKPGCRALTFNYASSTTATGEAPSQWGDYTGHLTRVYFTAYDTVSKAMKTSTVAQYSYDSKGHLRAVWDPRVSPALKTTYGYDAEGHLVVGSPPGREPWVFTYGTSATDSTPGRLIALGRPPASTELGNGEAPVKTAAPKLSGSAVVGVRMAVSDGTWSNAPLSYGYQWESCSKVGAECQPIAGATNPNYTPTSADVGHELLAQVTAVNSGGAVEALTKVTSPVTTSAQLAPPSVTQAVDPGNSVNAVSCLPGTTTCVVSDSKGNAYYATNVSNSANATWKAWTGPGTSPSEAVTCATSTMCLMAAGSASGYGGNLYYATSLGGAWTLAYAPTYGVDAITCVSATFCVDGQDGVGGFRFSTNPPSTSWTVESQGTAAMKAVSCLSTSFCAIADGAGNVHVATTATQLKSSSWTNTNVDGTTALNGIVCTSTTNCLVVDSTGTQLTLTISGSGAATVSGKHKIDATNSLNGISCSGSTCVTVDDKGNVFASINAGSTWEDSFQLGEKLTSVSCTSASLCVTADAEGNVTAFDPTFSQLIASGSSVNAVSCAPATTTCVASDSKGSAYYATNVSNSSPATWKAWAGPGTSPSEAVSCPTTTMCLMAAGTAPASGGNLYYATSLGGAWTLAFEPSYGVESIGCASSSFCVAGQEQGLLRYSANPPSTSWPVEQPGVGTMQGTSCISSSFCATADTMGDVHVATTTAQIESSTWTATDVDGSTALAGIACMSTSSCLAVDEAGNVLSLAVAGNGTATATVHNIDFLPLSAIACPSSSRCVVADIFGQAFVSTDGGVTWALAYQFADGIKSLSCASTSLCVASGSGGTVTSFNPTVGVAHEGELRSPTQRMTIEYGVPVSGTGAPYAMGSSDVAKWAQTDVPAEATAIFPPDEPVGWPASDYKRASVYYLDGSDRIVNVARPGGGIATSEYNSYGDEVRSLTPDNREASLKEGAKSAETSQTLDTQSTYGSEGTELLEKLGPRHTVKLANGTQVQARHHTVYSYDEGAPVNEEVPFIFTPYRLVTKVTEGAEITGEPEADVRTTKTAYAGQNNLGWILRAPTSVTGDPTGLKLTTTTVYDPQTGNVTETRTPGAGAPNEEVAPSYKYSSAFGSLGSGNGQLSKPDAIAKDSSGNLWVADTANNRVEEFSSGGTFVRKFGTLGTGQGELKSPEGITIDDKGNIWVADTGNNRIEEFSSEGAYMFQFKSPPLDTEFKGPSAIAFLPQSKTLVIADTGNNRVVAFTLEGLYSRTYASSGTGTGQVTKPEGVTIGPEGEVWVSDTGNNRIEEFSSGGGYGFQYGTAGSGNGQLSKPKGLAVDAKYHAFVADSGNSRIEEFGLFGSYVTAFGTSGTGNGNMSAPAGLVLDAADNAYVLDTGNNRVESWTDETKLHESSGTGGTYGKQTIYYSTAANSQVPACGDHPEWAGLPCQSKPAAQPETSGVPNLPVKTFSYDMWDDVLTSTEAVGTTTRTVTDTYDEAGRLLTENISSTVGTALPTVTYEYNSETGALVKQRTTVEGATKSLEAVYDKRGEQTSYKDADGSTSTVTYDIDGRPETINDGKGTQTYTYDTTTGLLSKLVDSAAGTFTATYDVEGNLTTAGYPNGMNVNHTLDPEGEETGVEYLKTTNCSSNCIWYSQTQVPSIHGQALSQASTFSSQTFTYDEAGRLTKAQDTPAGQGCTTRIYAYDVETNITSLTSRAPGAEGHCATEGGTVVNHTYDTANRLTDAGIAYGTFGDITTLPAGDAGGTQVTSAYYVDNTLASQTQNGQTIGYSLDPEGRTRQTVSTGTINSTVTSHYAGNGHAVAWTEDTGGKWTRNIYGLEGSLVAVQSNAETPVLQVEDLHGNLVATMSLSQTASGLLTKNDVTEYGVPRTSAPPKYSWLGSEAVATELPSGIIAMGARSYIPQIGRFLQPDPIEGGSANAYAYAFGDPINTSDPSGEYMVEMPEWVQGFLDEQAEIATEEAIERAAEEQAAREEAEEKAREAAAEAAEAAAEAAAGGGGKHGHRHAGRGHIGRGHVSLLSCTITKCKEGKLKLCETKKCDKHRKKENKIKEAQKEKREREKKEEEKEPCGREADYRANRGFGLNGGLYYGNGRVRDVCVETNKELEEKLGVGAPEPGDLGAWVQWGDRSRATITV